MPPSDELTANEIRLIGRLGAVPEVRVMPSGDVLVTFRVTVARPPGDRVRVDSIDCATVRPRVRRSLERSHPGAVLEIRGSLHRRFWRSPSGPASRYCVDVDGVRTLRAGHPDDATAVQTPALA